MKLFSTSSPVTSSEKKQIVQPLWHHRSGTDLPFSQTVRDCVKTVQDFFEANPVYGVFSNDFSHSPSNDLSNATFSKGILSDALIQKSIAEPIPQLTSKSIPENNGKNLAHLGNESHQNNFSAHVSTHVSADVTTTPLTSSSAPPLMPSATTAPVPSLITVGKGEIGMSHQEKFIKEFTKALGPMLEKLHPSEMAAVLTHLGSPQRYRLMQYFKPEFQAQVLVFLPANTLEDVVSHFSNIEMAVLIQDLKSDNGVFILSTLNPTRQQDILQTLPSYYQRNLRAHLAYEENTAGRLMQQEVLIFYDDWTLAECLACLKESSSFFDTMGEIFVLDHDQQVVGAVAMGALARYEKTTTLSSVMTKEVQCMNLSWSQEEVALSFRLYNLLCAPVVNEKGEMMGIITADDVIDVVEREVSEDLLYMGRIHFSDFYESVFKTSFGRIHWLILTLLNTLLTAMVINEFQETIQAKVALTVLMPVAAAMGGNTGIQAATVVIRALATRVLSPMNMKRTFWKEVRVAMFNGLTLASLVGIGAFFWLGDVSFSAVLFGAVFFNMVWAGCAGTLFPVIIDYLGGDPALSTGSVITTTTDVIGYAIFLSLARLLLR